MRVGGMILEPIVGMVGDGVPVVRSAIDETGEQGEQGCNNQKFIEGAIGIMNGNA